MKSTAQAISALERRFSPLRLWPSARPARGWLRAIRHAFGITTAQYASLLGVSQPRIIAIEKGEVDETVTLATLRRAAEALDCKLVYAIVPNQPMDKTLRERAQRSAEQQLARTSHTMRLENQGLSNQELDLEKARLIEELLDDPRRLWDEP
jgi:predicted DNA-binding mobile mystery protein A